MATLAAIYRTPSPRSSGKTGRFPHLKLAVQLARRVGMVDTWPNVQTIRLAIESEAAYSEISVVDAAAIIATAATEFSIVEPERYSFEAAHLLRKSNVVNRFWFEDALWRYKTSYQTALEKLQAETA